MTKAGMEFPEWDRLLQSLSTAGREVLGMTLHPQDPQIRQETVRLLLMTMSQAYGLLFHGDARHPEWVPFLNTLIPSGAVNPDTLYYYAPLEDCGTYRIRGRRGSVLLGDFHLGRDFTGTHRRSGPRQGNFNLDQLRIAEDGTFDLILSAERPADWAGDWIRLPPTTNVIMLRLVSYDWPREIDAQVAIERLDTPARKPRPVAARLEATAASIASFLVNYQDQFLSYERTLRETVPVNTIAARTLYENTGGMEKQWLYHGVFDLGPQDALLIETDVPSECYYWNIQLTDELHLALDPMHCQTSLNGRQARLDADGRFRAVISLDDPGVPNWLDPAGHRHGGIMGRWNRASSAPVPSMRKVPLARLRDHLPPDTPVFDARQRDHQLRERRYALQLRRR
ncbi:MAG: DUF1214 domain-containing protein [Gammaproteobacteria bacterium]